MSEAGLTYMNLIERCLPSHCIDSLSLFSSTHAISVIQVSDECDFIRVPVWMISNVRWKKFFMSVFTPVLGGKVQ